MIQKIYIVFRDFKRQMTRKNISSFAASTAFFLFLSLVPMLILICTIIPFTSLTEANLLDALTEVTPDVMNPLIITLVSGVYDKSAGVLSVAAVVTLWSAGKGMLALIRGLNEINEVEERRNYFVLRGVASFYTLIMLAVIVLLLLGNVFGNVLLNRIFARLPRMKRIFDFFLHFRFVLTWVILSVFFTAVYTYVPNKKLRFGMQIPGAVVSAVVWSVFSLGFSVYVENTNGFGMYGSLSVIVIIMLWLYCGMNILMLGAYINRYFGPAYVVLYRSRLDKKERAG